MGCNKSREAVSRSASSEASQSSWRSYRPSSLDSLRGQSIPESAAATVHGQAQGLVEMRKEAGEEWDYVCCHSRRRQYTPTILIQGLGCMHTTVVKLLNNLVGGVVE